jgi:hypothetical protein
MLRAADPLSSVVTSSRIAVIRRRGQGETFTPPADRPFAKNACG